MLVYVLYFGNTLLDIAAILVFVLPGFIAYRFVLQRRVDPTQRSTFWQISEIVEHSVFVHIIGIALSFILILIFKSAFGIATHTTELLQYRPADFLSKYFTEGVLWLTLYPLYVIVASSIIGAYNTPAKVSTWIVRGVSIATNWTSKRHKLLKWIPVPSPAYPPEPIWYYAFNRHTDKLSRIPIVIVMLKSGGVYVGEIASYPIVSDTQSEKDFLMRRASYYKDGDIYSNQQELDPLDNEIDAVLINTSEVDSIRLYYDNIQEDSHT